MANESRLGNSPLRPRFGGVLFNGLPPRAECLRYSHVEEDACTGIRFTLDERFLGTISVDWSEVGGPPSEAESRILALSLVGLVAQHALPVRIEGPTLPSGAAQNALASILRMLYDIRAFCDETPLRSGPALAGEPLPQADCARGSLSPRRVLVLLSGGFDSTFAAVLLKEAGFEVVALHVRSNRHVEEAEETAARALAERLGVAFHRVRLEAPDQESIGRYYSRTFGQFPFYNSVPHGRDFPLAVLAAILARRWGCARIAFGHEKESRHKVIAYRGRSIRRHDVESAYGSRVAGVFLRHGLKTGVRLFSPLAGLSIYRVRASLLRHYPMLASLVQSCFWSRRCEKCLKCLSTYTMQRHLGLGVFPFEQNPFADRDDRDMALLAEPDRPTEALAYGPQMHYALARIVRDGQMRAEDYWLQRFERAGLRQVMERWQAIEAFCLDAERSAEVPLKVQRVIEALL